MSTQKEKDLVSFLEWLKLKGYASLQSTDDYILREYLMETVVIQPVHGTYEAKEEYNYMQGLGDK